MSNKIRHSGIIDYISGDCVKVRILQTSACSQCKIAGHCSSTESKEKIVDVYNVTGRAGMKVGDKVVVTASARVAVSALLIGFGLPFAVMVAIMFIVYGLTSNEPLSALCSLGSLLPCYGTIFLFRERLRTNMAFEIE